MWPEHFLNKDNLNPHGIVTPGRIFEIGERSALVKCVLDIWKRGGLSWEQALLTMVAHLHAMYQDAARRIEIWDVPPLIICEEMARATSERETAV